MAPHEALGLAPEATLDEIHERFRALAAVLHPQVGGDDAEYHRLRESYAAFVAERCATLGVPPEEELALTRQDPFAAPATRTGVWSVASEFVAGVGDLAAFAAEEAQRRSLQGLFGGYAANEVRRADLDPTPMSFGAFVLAGLCGWAIAMFGLAQRHPELDGRLYALHGMFFAVAVVLGPTALTFALSSFDGRQTRQTWVGSTLAMGLLFAALSPLPFLAKVCAADPLPATAGAADTDS